MKILEFFTAKRWFADRQAAWHATQVFFMLLGFTLGMACLAALPWWLAAIALAFGWLLWFLVYRMELGWRARQDLLYSGFQNGGKCR